MVSVGIFSRNILRGATTTNILLAASKRLSWSLDRPRTFVLISAGRRGTSFAWRPERDLEPLVSYLITNPLVHNWLASTSRR